MSYSKNTSVKNGKRRRQFVRRNLDLTQEQSQELVTMGYARSTLKATKKEWKEISLRYWMQKQISE